jgi:peptidoglycan/xylan/chitin deacetylase (PgdA/CDA1 family)
VYGAVRRITPSRHAAILRYHAICGAEGHSYADPSICITPTSFRRHVAYLASAYRVLPLPDVVALLRAGRTLPPNTVAITFDDGYADNLPAARILAEHGLTATFYLTAGCLAGGGPFWLSELRALVRTIPAPDVRLIAGGREVVLPCATAGDRQSAIRHLSRLVKSHPMDVREDLREQLRRLAGNPDVPSPMLSWNEVAEMRRLGMDIGAHTLTHPNLPSAGLEDARREIAGAKARIERELGGSVSMFSYPNGGAERYVTPAIQQLVREAGFDAATTSANGFATHASDLFALERVEVAERLEDLIFALEVERFAFRPVERAHAPA